MSAAGTPSSDPWVVIGRERIRYEEQFKSLNPINGIITGEQAKGFLLQSKLPPVVLGQIWGLADTNADGKMDINEFSIACKLINLKLRGFDVPQVLPPTLIASLQMYNTAVPSVAPVIPQLPNAQPVVPINQQPILNSQLLSNLNSVPPAGGLQNFAQPNTTGSFASPLLSGILPPMSNTTSNVSLLSGNTGSPNIPVAASTAPSIIPNSIGFPIIPPSGISSSLSQVPISSFSSTIISNVNSVPFIPPTSVPVLPPSVPQVPQIPSAPGSITSATSTPRASIGSLDRLASVESPLVDWAVPHQTKLKYTQIFNTTDRTRSGYLSGVQARNVMVHTKLPQNILAQIWALSDMDSDGRLGSEEFVLAMHLCEQAAQGIPPPVTLAPDLIPPSFRRGVRTSSLSSQGSAQPEQDPASTLITTTFEDKRKENFEKGQAELDRRRKTLLDQQRKEAEERERKEREEIDRREKARQEAERRRLEELEKQMREQQEHERLKEEEHKRQAEQREAARREMERQRQLEWEKQRSQELQQQRQREQENVLKLKAKNQSLTIELSSLNDQIKDLSQKICDTRVGVSNVKTTIDGMRSTRDSQMQEMSQLKNKLKEQNAKLLSLSQEKAKIEAKSKQMSEPEQAFNNQEINIKNLRERIEDLQSQIDGKMSDIENNNAHLNDLRKQLTKLLEDCENLYNVYEQRREKVLEMKRTTTKNNEFISSGWNDPKTDFEWPVDDWKTETAKPATVKYRAIYEFDGRNNDEISFQPGDIINVPIEQSGEPGWLAGEIRGRTGWFPESYVELIDSQGVNRTTGPESAAPVVEQSIIKERLEGIAEIPENVVAEPVEVQETKEVVSNESVEYYISSYPYQSVEQGDLSFNAGDIISVVKKDGDWWTGKLGNNVGIFPSNYVQKYDSSTSTNNIVSNVTTSTNIESINTSTADLQTAQVDNEVSQITESKLNDKSPPDYSSSNAQAIRGNKKPEIASVIAPYQATSPEQLSLQRGQLIMIRKKTDSGWWEGELQAKGRKRQVGWFPASYVKVLNSSGKTSGRNTPVSTTRIQQEVVIDKMIALYPYTAANPDELSFLKDDIISVTAREEPSWWRGELNGVSGLFPSNYVAPLQQ